MGILGSLGRRLAAHRVAEAWDDWRGGLGSGAAEIADRARGLREGAVALARAGAVGGPPTLRPGSGGRSWGCLNSGWLDAEFAAPGVPARGVTAVLNRDGATVMVMFWNGDDPRRGVLAAEHASPGQVADLVARYGAPGSDLPVGAPMIRSEAECAPRAPAP